MSKKYLSEFQLGTEAIDKLMEAIGIESEYERVPVRRIIIDIDVDRQVRIFTESYLCEHQMDVILQMIKENGKPQNESESAQEHETAD